MGFGNRGLVSDKFSSRILWICAIGSAIGLYMVSVERQGQNRAKMMAEALAAGDSAEDPCKDPHRRMKTIMSRKCPLLMLLLVLLCSSFCFAHRTLPESAGVHSHASRLRFVIADEPKPPGSYSPNAGLEQQIFDPQPPDSFSANAALEEQMFDPQLPDSYLANAAALKQQVFDPQPPDSYTANAAGLEQQQRSYYHHL